MSRSSCDKPFYVDVGTSIVAVRCASNHDVIFEFNHHGRWEQPQSVIQMAKHICDRMNKEVEIHKPLRNCDVGTAEEQNKRYELFCIEHRTYENCCGDCPCKEVASCELGWAQMPYEEGGLK